MNILATAAVTPSGTPGIATHIISGFLGAGKTTLLQSLLQQKPENEIWAVLINEFGQIGIDQQLLPQQSGYVVKELLGGCLCCSSQLPMQIALSRLIQDVRPDRLFIEPTGLGHPAQLLDQLTEPQWQTVISMRGLVTVVDGTQLGDQQRCDHPIYQDQLKAAQMVVVSHADLMNAADLLALEQLKDQYLAQIRLWKMADHGNIQLQEIDQALILRNRKVQALIHLQKQQKQLHAEHMPAVIQQLPYHYTETAQGFSVAGWRFSKRWKFDFYAVLDLLSALPDWFRIKAIFYTNQGWISFNFNPDQFNYRSCAENIDSRIEIIAQSARDWEDFESTLLNCRLD